MPYNKYHARKTKCLHGHTHDSKKEAVRCNELHLLQKAGNISNLETQVKYELLPAQRRNGKVIERKVDYIADFRYTRDGMTYVEDTKGQKTKDYIIKRKLFKCKYPNVIFLET